MGIDYQDVNKNDHDDNSNQPRKKRQQKGIKTLIKETQTKKRS